MKDEVRSAVSESIGARSPIRGRFIGRAELVMFMAAAAVVGILVGGLVVWWVVSKPPVSDLDVGSSQAAPVSPVVQTQTTVDLIEPSARAIAAVGSPLGRTNTDDRTALQAAPTSEDPLLDTGGLRNLSALLGDPAVNPQGLVLAADEKEALRAIVSRIDAEYQSLRTELHKAVRQRASEIAAAGGGTPVRPGEKVPSDGSNTRTMISVNGTSYVVQFDIESSPEFVSLDAASDQVLADGLAEVKQFVNQYGDPR
jgi:hypothetical protein